MAQVQEQKPGKNLLFFNSDFSFKYLEEFEKKLNDLHQELSVLNISNDRKQNIRQSIAHVHILQNQKTNHQV
jgi:hypothetical protein